MIYGVGIDLVMTSRIEEALRRWGERFREKVFSAGEIQYFLCPFCRQGGLFQGPWGRHAVGSALERRGGETRPFGKTGVAAPRPGQGALPE